MTTDRQQWLAERRKGIGGSDVAAILGLSKWKSPLDIYNEKTSEEPPTESEPNPSIEWGVRLEPVVRQAYSDKTGRVVAVPEKQFVSTEHPFMIANVDGVCEDRLLEIKTARTAADWGEDGTDEIPEYYLTQVMHYMIVTGFRKCDVAVLIGASDFRIYTVDYDEELAEMLIKAEAKFWKMVEDRTPPAPRTLAEMKSAFPVSLTSKVEATSEIADAAAELAQVKASMDKLKEQADSLTAKLQGFMGAVETLSYEGSTIATWKMSKPTVRLDSAALKAAMPDIYNQYAKEGKACRRFLLKL